MEPKKSNTTKHKQTPRNTASLYLEMLLSEYIPIYLEKHPDTAKKSSKDTEEQKGVER